jgi:hypothetical protein
MLDHNFFDLKFKFSFFVTLAWPNTFLVELAQKE